MKCFSELSETIGFAKVTDIVPAGTDITIRMIEGDIDIRAAENVYIMIGAKGNIYPIEKEKFEASYIPTDKPYEIISEYDPTG